MPAHTNSFIVLCDGVKSDFMACARQSDSELVLLSQLDAWPSRRPGSTARAAGGGPGAAPQAAWALMQFRVDALATSWPGRESSYYALEDCDG